MEGGDPSVGKMLGFKVSVFVHAHTLRLLSTFERKSLASMEGATD